MTAVEGPVPYPYGFVYFFGVRGLPEIKIGNSAQIKCRLYETRRKGITQSAYPILLVRGGSRLEARFHAAFEPHHLGHEWFAPAPEILEAIEAIKAGVFDWSRLPDTGWCVTRRFQTKASLAHWGPLPRFAAAA